MIRALRLLLPGLFVTFGVMAEAPVPSLPPPPAASSSPADGVRALLDAKKNAEGKEAASALLAQLAADGKSETADGAEALHLLARAQEALGDRTAALVIYEQALALRERLFGPDGVELVPTLNNLALVYRDTGQPVKARGLFERSIAIRERKLGPDAKELSGPLFNLGVTLRTLGDYDAAAKVMQRTVALRERAFGPRDGKVADAHNELANILQLSGDLDGAESLYRQALENVEEQQGRDTAGVKLNLGVLLLRRGKLAEARALSEQQVAALEPKGTEPEQRAERKLELALALNNLGYVLLETGDLEGARAPLERALALRKSVRPPDPLLVSETLLNLGRLADDAGDPAGAAAVYSEALELRRGALGPRSLGVAEVLNRLGVERVRLDDLGVARRLFEEALDVRREALGEDHPAVATVLSNLADVRERQGERAAALSLFARAVEIREKALGASHPLTALCRSREAAALARSGHRAEALDLALRAEVIGREELQDFASRSPERQALAFLGQRVSGLPLALAISASGVVPPEDRSRVFEALARSRATVLSSSLEARADLRATTDAETRGLLAAWRKSREQLATLILAGPGGPSASDYARRMENTRSESERLEAQLAERVGRTGVAHDPSVGELVRALPPATALVAYAYYADDLLVTGRSAPSYLAFVLAPGRAAPDVVPLGAAGEVDALVGEWHDQIATVPGMSGGSSPRNENSYRRAAEALRRGIWDPVVGRLGKAEQVFIVPDGTLQVVSFATLPGSQGRYLAEIGPRIHMLAAERDVLRDRSGTGHGRGIAAFGGIDFDAPRGEGSMASARAPLRCHGDDLHFEPLPSSRSEVEHIGTFGGRDDNSIDNVTKTGSEATKRAFVSLAPGRRIVHTATHAFTVSEDCLAHAAQDAARPVLDRWSETIAKTARTLGSVTPVVSGLAFAGANADTRSDSAAGSEALLNQFEIPSIDLGGVEWVVLSGCETGVGDLVAGEGVLGLRRAFLAAGARTVIGSLWRVQDDAVREWMDGLYERRLRGELSTSQVVQAASVGMIERRRREGRSTHPYFWGAFVAVGDWR